MALKITKIPATKSLYTKAPLAEAVKRRVCGYARVSTDQEDQQTSYEAQLDYYTNYIKEHDNWVFTGMYSDEGITGTSIKKRDGFNTMVRDALDGKIDLIITKSVSRFARNTVDSLTTVRKLKEKGVEIYFEKENIWTLDAKGELLITIMSSLAQEESRSISQNVTWGKRKQFADGKVSFDYNHFLGYDKGEDGNLVINPEQAETVREIYKLFLSGYSYIAITKELERQGRITPRGNTKWSDATVRSILSNEKYKGDVLLQKSYIEDFLTKKQVKNNGEVQQYYISGHHEPIVSPEIFDMAQRELDRRAANYGKYSGKRLFSSKLICGDCGGYYGSKVWHSNSKYKKMIWQCRDKFKNDPECCTPHLYEEDIKEYFMKALKKLWKNKDDYIDDIKLLKPGKKEFDAIQAQLDTATFEMEKAIERVENLVYDNTRMARNQSEYNSQYEELVVDYEEKKSTKEKLEKELEDAKIKASAINKFISTLRKMDAPVTEFNDNLWNSMVETMTVYKSGGITFKLRSGFEIKVR